VGADATRVLRDAAGRPAGEHDPRGTPLSALEWRSDGGLCRAHVRLPDGEWLTIEPGGGAPGPWGASDLITRGGRTLTRMAAVNWQRVGRIPAVEEPARLPAGAGTAVFNLIARLAVEHGVEVVRYDAPYPTESLFLALLESFHFVPAHARDPRAAFAAGALAWTPAPHEVAIEAGDVWVQRRERIEKIVAGGRAYYRADWQGVRRLAPRAVRDDSETVRASLIVLSRVVEDHVVLDADGRVLARPASSPDPSEVTPLTAEVVAGLVATVVATSAPPLAPWLAAAARDIQFVWGPVDADLIATSGDRITLSHRLRRALADATRGRERGEALAAALALLREAADLVGDGLRGRAQAALAAEPAEVQARALDADAPPVADARAIATAAAALARDAAGW
jgi:hypothetical protein